MPRKLLRPSNGPLHRRALTLLRWVSSSVAKNGVPFWPGHTRGESPPPRVSTSRGPASPSSPLPLQPPPPRERRNEPKARGPSSDHPPSRPPRPRPARTFSTGKHRRPRPHQQGPPLKVQRRVLADVGGRLEQAYVQRWQQLTSAVLVDKPLSGNAFCTALQESVTIATQLGDTHLAHQLRRLHSKYVGADKM